MIDHVKQVKSTSVLDSYWICSDKEAGNIKDHAKFRENKIEFQQQQKIIISDAKTLRYIWKGDLKHNAETASSERDVDEKWTAMETKNMIRDVDEKWTAMETKNMIYEYEYGLSKGSK